MKTWINSKEMCGGPLFLMLFAFQRVQQYRYSVVSALAGLERSALSKRYYNQSIVARSYPLSMSKMNCGDKATTPHEPSSEDSSVVDFKSFRRVHHVAVCLVPPESLVSVWETLSGCRRQLRDPGFHRWPPHANLLYPFLDLPESSCDASGDAKPHVTLQEIVAQLEQVCRSCEPFEVKLEKFGSFGGKKRGVLWLDPVVTPEHPDGNPLMCLQSKLSAAFPVNQNLNKAFVPHMTVGHFPTLDEALQAQAQVEPTWPGLAFPVDRIYLLKRSPEASSQFLRVADIPLGNNSAALVHSAPIPFANMPTIAEDWVHEEQQKLKQRR